MPNINLLGIGGISLMFIFPIISYLLFGLKITDEYYFIYNIIFSALLTLLIFGYKQYLIKYKLNEEYIYVGSTIRDIKTRWKQHLREYNKKTNTSLLYQTMRETNDIENWYIELHSEYHEITRAELLQIEEGIIKQIGTLNTVNNRSQHILEYNRKQREHQEITDRKIEEGDIEYIYNNTAYVKTRDRILNLLNASPDYSDAIRPRTIQKYNLVLPKELSL
jgi:Uri superfamily endonuclease